MPNPYLLYIPLAQLSALESAHRNVFLFVSTRQDIRSNTITSLLCVLSITQLFRDGASLNLKNEDTSRRQAIKL